jgi:channel protein (hemolysin III family)
MHAYGFLGFSEPFSSLSHFIGAIVCLILSIPMWRSAKGHFGHRLAIGVFCFATIFLLSMSGVYHLLPPGSSGKIVLQRLDHAAIFVMIAGTFTPLHSILFRGVLRWLPLVVIWTIAVVGIIMKTIFFSEISEFVGVGTYLGMGWLGMISAVFICIHWGFGLAAPLIKGAIAYSIGTVFEFLKGPTLISGVIGPHELFHIAVLMGITYHWKFIRSVALQASCLKSQRLN